ncbi:MAG: lamin tail domain-containing protein [Chloroflexota bacterium]
MGWLHAVVAVVLLGLALLGHAPIAYGEGERRLAIAVAVERIEPGSGATAPISAAVRLPNGFFVPTTDDGLGYAIVDETGGPPFATAFHRLGGVDGLGAPISRPFMLPDGRIYQATRYALLVWRPGATQAEVADALDLMGAAGLDDWLWARGVPRPVSETGDADPARAAAMALARLGWLTEPSIRQAYFGIDDGSGGITVDALLEALARYGLPASWPERFDDHMTQRFQRGAVRVQVHGEAPIEPPEGDEPRLEPGNAEDAALPAAVAVPVGELLKESGLLSDAALAPDRLVGGRLVARAPRPQLAWPSDTGWGVPAPAPPASATPAIPATSEPPPPAAAPTTPGTPTATASPDSGSSDAALPQPGASVVIRTIVNEGRTEHVELANEGTVAQDLTGWTLRSVTSGQSYPFPSGFVLNSGASVHVHSGAGDPAALHRPPSDLFAVRRNIWRNTGAIAQLLDPRGQVVYEYRYGTP